MELVKKLAEIQQKLKAPKSQRNNFGNYNYRNCEDILEAVKPLLGELILTITDEIVLTGDRYYVKATATITDGTASVVTNAYAREVEEKKGMDGAQITGASSSYARKYALNGLFLIDDTKDSDSQDNRQPETKKTVNDFKAQLRVKISNYAKANKLNAEKPEDVIKIIADKTGVTLKDLKELNDEMAKDLIGMWSN